MEYLIILLLLICILAVLAVVYEFNMKKLKEFAKIEEARLNKLADKYPDNTDICKSMLDKIKNNKVKIEEDKNSKTCLYIAVTNKIIIADVKNSYTRMQTIAHECLHSIQSRKILLFNFIFSNIYLIYFFIITLLGLFKILPYKMLFLSIMLILSYTYYFVRSFLEDDAMTKARFLAKSYMEDVKISTKEEIDEIITSYDRLNEIGIKATNYSLMFETIVKVIILSIVFLIR